MAKFMTSILLSTGMKAKSMFVLNYDSQVPSHSNPSLLSWRPPWMHVAYAICSLLINEGQYGALHFNLEPHAEMDLDRLACRACIKLQLQTQWLFAPTLLWG